MSDSALILTGSSECSWCLDLSGPISEQASKFGLLDFVVWPCSAPKCVKVAG